MAVRSKLNFVGAGVTVTDDSAGDQLNVSIPGGTADLDAHAADTTSVHGIADTSLLVKSAQLPNFVYMDRTSFDALSAANGLANNTAYITPQSTGGGGGPVTFASDTWARSVTDGFGSAPTGGAWTLGGTAADFDVNSGSATIAVPQGAGTPAAGVDRTAFLATVSQLEQVVEVVFSMDKSAPTGGSFFFFILLRATSGTQTYRLRMELTTASLVRLTPQKFTSSQVDLSAQSASLVTYTANTKLRMKAQVTGTNPTTINGKLWVDGTTEPGTWAVTATDSDALLQSAAPVGLYARSGGGTTSGTMTVTLWPTLTGKTA